MPITCKVQSVSLAPFPDPQSTYNVSKKLKKILIIYLINHKRKMFKIFVFYSSLAKDKYNFKIPHLLRRYPLFSRTGVLACP